MKKKKKKTPFKKVQHFAGSVTRVRCFYHCYSSLFPL